MVDAPAGETSLLRAAEAQERVRSVNAAAAVWIEQAPSSPNELGTLVRAVGPIDQEVRHALLPDSYDRVTPRVFAVIVSSLIDELVALPDLPFEAPTPDTETPTVDTPTDPATNAVVVEARPDLDRRIIGGYFTPFVGTSLKWRGRDSE